MHTLPSFFRRRSSRIALAAGLLLLAGPATAQAKFNPAQPILIRPFGDSITFGYGFATLYPCPAYPPPPAQPGQAPTPITPQQLEALQETQLACRPPIILSGGYRYWLTAMALMSGQAQFMTEGYQNGGSGLYQWVTGTQAHDGYPGFRTDQLLPVSGYNSFADATLVHAGTNDMIQYQLGFTKTDPTFAFNSLVSIVKNLLAKNSKTQVFVAKIISTAPPNRPKGFNWPPANYDYQTVNKNIAAYNNLIATNLISQLPTAAQSRVTIVDMTGKLDPNTDYIFDGIHPNSLGYVKIACNWSRAIYSAPMPCPGDSAAQIEKILGFPPGGPLPPMHLPLPEELDRVLPGWR